MTFLSGIFHNYIDFFYAVGYFGEYIVFLITCALIFNQHLFFGFYILFFILNRIINQYLKKLLKGNRPSHPKKYLESDKFSKNKYGMPSGHSQITFFSIAYCYFVTKKFIPWILLLLIIGMILVYERYFFRNHTMKQLVYGMVIGVTFGFICYYIVDYIEHLK